MDNSVGTLCSCSIWEKNIVYNENKDNFYVIYRNPSGGSGLSETGSLDRAKAALERRKKAEDGTGNPILCRVEVTRPNPDSLIDELLKATNLEQTDLESSESTYILYVCVCFSLLHFIITNKLLREKITDISFF